MFKAVLNFIKDDINNEQRLDYLVKNRLLLIFRYEHNFDFNFYENEKIKTIYAQNKGKYLLQKLETINIDKALKSNGINPIHFKGISLALYLYLSPDYRQVGNDIDIYVNQKDYDKAKKVLCDLGYISLEKEGANNPHHIKLRKHFFIIELHKNIFNPFTNIDEEYLLRNIIKNDFDIFTFDITTSFLHLIYHLYMDTYLAAGNIYYFYTNATIPKATGFIFRAYEIIMFSKKYFNEIKWKEIIDHIKTHKFRIFFKNMIQDILDIYPETFPKQFIDTINVLNYVDDERDYLYKRITESNLPKEKIDNVLCGFINTQWSKRENIQIYNNGDFVLDNTIIKDDEIAKDYQLACVVNVESVGDDVKLQFKISNDDFCFSEIGNYDTQASDGVHLIICGTEKYSYNSLFLFPKEIDNKITVVPVDVLNSVNRKIDENYISATYDESEAEYTITAILKKDFLQKFNLEKYFYFGLVISDCSSKTKTRKSELILSNPHSEWYNPIHFAKINISQKTEN